MQIANTHLLPLIIFGYDYHHGDGQRLAEGVEDVLLAKLKPPLVLCGDFGMSNGQSSALPRVINGLDLKNALSEKPTYHAPSEVGGMNTADRIYFSAKNISSMQADVVVTQTDHYLCWADIALREP